MTLFMCHLHCCCVNEQKKHQINVFSVFTFAYCAVLLSIRTYMMHSTLYVVYNNNSVPFLMHTHAHCTSHCLHMYVYTHTHTHTRHGSYLFFMRWPEDAGFPGDPFNTVTNRRLLNPWLPLHDMLNEQGLTHAPLLRLKWRTRLLHPMFPYCK